jgi:hypothetical protein
MSDKPDKDEFLDYIHFMWKRGEISERALIKIREKYCNEKQRKQEDVSEDTLQMYKQPEEKTIENNSYNSRDINNNLDLQINKEEYKTESEITVNQIYNNEVKDEIEKQYNKDKTQSIYEKSKQTKERNITVILNLGILLILLAGIILATSTWDLMSNGVKTITLCMVSILFFAMSSFTEKKLKIAKTSFAFWILGNLFLPIILLSIGYFKLLGNYLSIAGEGKYIYGIISATICLIFFGYSSKKYKNTTFTWIALIDSQILYWFILMQLELKHNMKILMFIIYALILTGIYHKLHKKEYTYDFFTKTIKFYTLINLIIDTFFVLGNTIYATFGTMTNETKGFSQGMIIILGIVILAGIMTYWTYEFKFHGGVFVSSILILAIHMICVTLRINDHEFLYYIVMDAGLIAIYGMICYYNNFKYLRYIKARTDIIILVAMVALDLIASIKFEALYTAILLYILTMVIVINIRKAKGIIYLKYLKTAVGITLFIANLFSLAGFELINNLLSSAQFHVGFIYIIFNIGIIYGISLMLHLIKKSDYNIYLYEGHIFLGFLYCLTLIFEIDRLITGIAIMSVFIICLLKVKNEFKLKAYLYGLITIITIVLIQLESFLHFNEINIFILKSENLLLCVGLVLTVIWKYSKQVWRERLNIYIIGIYCFGFLSSIYFNNFVKMDYIFICFLIGCMVLMGVFLCKSKNNRLIYIPGVCFLIMSARIIYHFDMVNQIIANCFVAGIIIALSYILYNVYEKISIKEMMCFNILAGLPLAFAVIISFNHHISYGFNIFALIAFGTFLYYISTFLSNEFIKRSLIISCIIFEYIAYGRFILELKFLGDFKMYFLLIPSIIVLDLVINPYLEKKNGVSIAVLTIWYSIIGSILLFNHYKSSSFQAIAFCGLCIISIIAGFIIQNKIYFIGGAVFLLIGVILNTLSFWLNIPWWIYLLVGGTLLIVFASKNEFNKSHKKDKKENFIIQLIKRVKSW